MSKALSVLKLFFSLVSINSTETQSSVNRSTGENATSSATVVSTLSPVNGMAFVGRSFRIPVPRVSRLQLSMKTEHNGDIAPSSWVQFDRKKSEVFGFPLPGNLGVFMYKLVGNDRKGMSDVHDRRTMFFTLNVQSGDFKHNHEVVLKTGTNFQHFMTRVDTRIDFVTRLARHCFNEKPSSIWIKSFTKGSKELTIVFMNIPSSPCDEDALKALKASMVDEDNNVKPQLQKVLTARFPIESVQFKLFAPCDPNLFGPEPPFEWGWLKHFIPIAILFCVVGIPVVISILVNKFRTKPPVLEEPRRPRTLMRRKEDGTDFSFHTVHFNNRHPSMLSISNCNSKEDCVGEEDKAHGGRVNIPNGSASGRTLMVPNATPNRPRQGTAEGNTTKNQPANKNNPFKFPIKDRSSVNIRAMWDDDDDEERPPLNIPTYYTYRNNQDEEPSMLDAVMDMNFSDLAGNISSKIKGFKSMLNVSQGQGGEQEEEPLEPVNTGPTLSSKLKGFGKSMLNVSLGSNEASMPTPSTAETAPSLSAKLKGFGKSMLNISSSAQGEETKDETSSLKQQRPSYEDSDDSDSCVYKPRESSDRMNEGYRLSRDENSEYELSRYTTTHRPSVASSDYESSQYNVRRPSAPDTRYTTTHMPSVASHNESSQYNVRRTSAPDTRYTTTHRPSVASSDYESSQYNVRRPSASSDYYERRRDEYGDYYDNCGYDKRNTMTEPTNYDYEDYPEPFFDMKHEEKKGRFDQEKSIFDMDFEEEDENSRIPKPTSTWNHCPPTRSQDDMQIQSVPTHIKYNDYPNPSEYCNGPTRGLRSKSSRTVHGTGFSSPSSFDDFWGEVEYEKEHVHNAKDSSQGQAYVFSSFTKSAPDLTRTLGKGSLPNGTKAKNRGNPRDKPAVTCDDEEERDSSVVGLIKTRVTSLLDSDGNVSKWFSGLQKNDSLVT